MLKHPTFMGRKEVEAFMGWETDYRVSAIGRSPWGKAAIRRLRQVLERGENT